MTRSQEFWRDRRVFVTGCTGLLGSWMVRALYDAGAQVVGLIRDHVAGSECARSGLLARIDVVHGAVEDYLFVERCLAEYEVQTVFHLAAQTIVGIANRSPLSTFETNIKGTWCILEAARRCGLTPHVVVASSDKAYGEQERLPYTEDAPLAGRHPYDVSKSCADMLSLAYHQTYGMPVCVTRCGNLYGGGDLNWNRIIPGTIRSVLRGQRPIVRSDGSFKRDYFFVRDAVEAYLHLAEQMAVRPEVQGHAFNFSTEMPLTVLQMVDAILGATESDLEPDVRNEARNEIPHQFLSAAKARALLQWSPRHEFQEAIRETVEWYRAYLSVDAEPRGCAVSGRYAA